MYLVYSTKFDEDFEKKKDQDHEGHIIIKKIEIGESNILCDRGIHDIMRS
jgi:hypothetical protein